MILLSCSTGILFLIVKVLVEEEHHFILGISKEILASMKENKNFFRSQRQKCFS